ncbi:MAG: helix-turn-helix transcriptional regulator [Sphaerochaeta sp.]|nr:helix-turn-helix transcriptional regulator [Sphaerochaeta sp.]
MLELTKTPLTDGSGNIQLCLVVPGHQAERVEKAVSGVLDLAESLNDEFVILPKAKFGRALRGFRKREGMSQETLAAQLAEEIQGAPIKYSQRIVSAMERGQRTIQINEAKALAKILNTDPRCFVE